MTKEELIKQRMQLEQVLEYLKELEKYKDQEEKIQVEVDKIEDRNDYKLTLFKNKMNNIIGGKNEKD